MGKTKDIYQPIVEILEDILGECHSHNDYSGQISFDCPVCSYDIKGLDKGDGKGNLEVNYKQEVYKCWSCSDTHYTRGPLLKLIKQFGSEKQLKKYKILRPDEITDEGKKVYKKVELPKEFIPFRTASLGLKMTHHYKYAYNYLRNRNVTDEMIQKFNIGFCYEGFYANRIIIPSYDDNYDLNYFTARSYESKPMLKYRNPEAEKEVIIYNEYLIDWKIPIFLVEGPFDSIFVPNSIPMLGKVLSEHLFKKLYEKATEIVIVLDGDAYASAVKIYNKLNGGRLFGKIWITRLPEDKDIADLQGVINDDEIYKLD
jgi:DNA primase